MKRWLEILSIRSMTNTRVVPGKKFIHPAEVVNSSIDNPEPVSASTGEPIDRFQRRRDDGRAGRKGIAPLFSHDGIDAMVIVAEACVALAESRVE